MADEKQKGKIESIVNSASRAIDIPTAKLFIGGGLEEVILMELRELQKLLPKAQRLYLRLEHRYPDDEEESQE